MVGVPGRSKGCNTCRRRKKGCDLQRPTCGQCHKAGIECAGYERKRIFVNVTAPAKNKTSRETEAVQTTPTIVPAASLSRSAYEDRVIDLFWDGYMPGLSVRLQSSPVMRYALADWMDTLQSLYKTDTALRQALLAFGLATVGRREGQRWMMEDGLKLYCQAPGATNAGLRHPRRWKSDALLLASRLLGVYELLYGADDRERRDLSQADSWQGHALGEAALVMNRGPAGHIDGHAHQLLCSGRVHLTTIHIKLRQRCFLSYPAWKTIPWTRHPKSPRDVMIDTFVDVPGLLESLDLLRDCDPGPEKEFRRTMVVEECWRMDRELTWWFENLGPKTELEDLEARGVDNPTVGDVAVASIMCLFYTACLLTYSSLRLATATKADVELPERTDPRIYCTKIANTVGVFFAPAAGTWGMLSAPLPIGMALVYLNSTEAGFASEDKRKLASFFVKTNSGVGIGKFLVSTQSNGIVPRGSVVMLKPAVIRAKARSWIGPAE
ncbi:Beauvericin cluster-specific repressor BEA4 [Colletotrichum sidae]|uniref:Beauvericin cluster-specific repressor BEA4 n=1 Tax=Colletotrichum sidae TaxID=1347389 RepID=A0A4R8TI31_9PEZI|nr:Beauvericin cluster-specific repressor BEA4 [Colletotrichum sidae]